MGAIHVLGIEEERLLLREDPRTEPCADRVPDAVADDGRDHEQPVQPPDIEMPRRCEQSRRDQEGVAREKAADEEPRLGEDNRDQQEVAAPLDERVEGVCTGEDAVKNVHAK